MYMPEHDSTFARALLMESSRSPQVKGTLAFVAVQLSDKVLAPIIGKLKEGSVLTEEENQTIEFLATEHSKEGMQWGGAMPELTKGEIMGSRAKKLELLEILATRLSGEYITEVDDEEKLAGVMKAMTDCSFCYVEKLNSLHSEKFNQIKSNIFPTPEELAIRVTRKEVGQKDQIATTFGIGRELGVDLVPKENPILPGHERVHVAGKSAFAGADTMLRVQVLLKSYQDVKQRHDTLEVEIEAQSLLHDTSGMEARLAELKKEMKTLSDKLTFYRVPLDRPVTLEELMPPKPFIETLAEMGGSPGKLPLVATASGTTARTLIALQDIGAFNQSGFDPSIAQTVSSTLCSTIVHGGHHSVLEVGEMYNRLLDYHAINAVESGYSMDERAMPYYEIGDSFTLVPPSMREDVGLRQQSLQSIGMTKGLKSQLTDFKQTENPTPPKPSGGYHFS
ncbi:hypothetical protein GH742_06730 [Legionella sp. MW5194]|uniref:hypothetical protein n=1 Tax=Legionella sp. MW5194 TaxID=2662448 RepID=UPI00193CB5B8|nr:hypothetical protein [Legionella sp. MW5194]QRN03579.1 hypothetical protein GH742_06730 [Legionella sp. MW5194]